LSDPAANESPESLASESALLLPASAESAEGQERLRELVSAAEATARRKYSANTLRAYKTALAHFQAWCAGMGITPIPGTPELLAAYLESHHDALVNGEVSLSTVGVRRAAVVLLFATAGQPRIGKHELVTAWVEAATREFNRNVPRQAMTVDVLRAAVDKLEPGRARTLLLYGFESAMRRSELCDLNVTDLEFSPEGVLATLARSKTNQRGEYEAVAVRRVPGAYCAVAALEGYLNGRTAGPVFLARDGTRLRPWTVSEAVKAAVESVGLAPERYGAHSLRSGFATEAARRGKNEFQIAAHLRHKSTDTTRRYVQAGRAFSLNISGLLGDP